MAVNNRAKLHQFLQQTCRESLKIEYVSAGNKQVTVKIGSAQWTSERYISYVYAMDDAASKAYDALQYKTERQIRLILNLPQRQSVEEADYLRNIMKSFKKKIKHNLPPEQQQQAIKKLVALYPIIDELEQLVHKYCI